ncbi:P-loop containing nucleoside triphosphate hydrolase protein [Epithele typhae]|uniref:P-loop containing nucleoside triphosphate hydrolase protein n=1 Tax=Epithele typhae TaxID=378194 RepID=UPI00200872EB|nr:P-loop containing nucleoside triphosphate hydrolase protein [Epithele typhae]KAH9921943.1 P-loop containing nucleoside triphosphate hydrolase protein [Epithele typhae]
MSSDEYFEDELGDLDSAFLNELDAIEATHLPGTAAVPSIRPQPPRKSIPQDVIDLGHSSDYGEDLVLDETDFAKIDEATQQGFSPRLLEVIHLNHALLRRPSKGAQLNLFGEIAQEPDPSKNSGEPTHRTFERTRSTLRQMPLPGQAKRTKQWDRTAYAKSGWRKPKEKVPTSGDEDEVPLEFEQFPAPEVPSPQMKLHADRLAAKTWIYPLNKPKRDYQYNIVKNCLVENTLVAIPTGLGKTFIAGVVMLNFYNWFPEGKVVFVAPTKPLVAQQIDACHKTCGIPGNSAAELTGNVSADKRASAAHRGTGDYAYAQVVRYMMQHNPHFRILALTATPGGKPEAVQAIVDALHISHIEIRSEADSDLKKYLHTKHEQEHLIPINGEIAVLRDGLVAVINPILKKVQGAGFLRNGNTAPTMLHPFRCQAVMVEMRTAKAPQYVVAAAAQLGCLARAMGYLLENSVQMAYGYMKDIRDDPDNNTKKALRKMNEFSDVMKKFDDHAQRGLSSHPKMDVLKTVLIDHFAKQLPDESDGARPGTGHSRAMVFVSFRECVEEIVELLNQQSPIIRAKAFIGQGTDKQGRKGYAQKEQLQVIEQFKQGEHNVLVSTSIGEEGLDIGEVDVIVCYDAQKTPIRMLQRIGRTGRKASGTVHILLALGREEHNWQKAQSNYAEVQHFIVRASDLEVYGDVDRLLPADIEPECVEMVMEIEEYVRDERPVRGAGSPKPKKRKRDDHPLRNVPAAAAKGFVSVRDLLVKGVAKRRKKLKEVDLEHAGESDSDDAEIEAGLYGPQRTKSAPTASATTTASSSKSGSSATGKKAGKVKARPPVNVGTEDDSDDEAIDRGLDLQLDNLHSTAHTVSAPGFRSAKDLFERSSSPDIPLNSIIDLTEDSLSIARTESASSIPGPDEEESQSGHPPPRTSNPATPAGSCSASSDESVAAAADNSMAWLIADDDDDPFVPITPPAPKSHHLPIGTRPTPPHSSPLCLRRALAPAGSMGPPALPSRLAMQPSPDASSDDAPFFVSGPPPATFAVRAPGAKRKRPIADTSIIDLSSSPTTRKKRRFRDAAHAARHNPWINVEASHSGDELSAGASSDRDDRRFTEALPETQVAPEYDQAAVYRRSLMTQAPGAPAFARGLVRRGGAQFFADGSGGGGAGTGARRKPRWSSPTEAGEDEGPDEYMHGSFVVDDDAEISFEGVPSDDDL